MKTYTVEFRVSVPDEVTEDQTREWVRFAVGDTCSLDASPLSNRELSPDAGSFVMWPR